MYDTVFIIYIFLAGDNNWLAIIYIGNKYVKMKFATSSLHICFI